MLNDKSITDRQIREFKLHELAPTANNNRERMCVSNHIYTLKCIIHSHISIRVEYSTVVHRVHTLCVRERLHVLTFTVYEKKERERLRMKKIIIMHSTVTKRLM